MGIKEDKGIGREQGGGEKVAAREQRKVEAAKEGEETRMWIVKRNPESKTIGVFHSMMFLYSFQSESRFSSFFVARFLFLHAPPNRVNPADLVMDL
ncbi:hypothetical protein RJT34_00328 [Clitoria ternatea]|uniref:Uncharacterized protein n=1 Tax=Clitoria ternatea TaxID=43366 RepID=A0AAN9PZ82_CLITE